jgi:hypothetical protein
MKISKRQPRATDPEVLTTVYINDTAFSKCEQNFRNLEKIAQCDCALGLGGNYVNVYTRDAQAIARVVGFLDEINIIEISK